MPGFSSQDMQHAITTVSLFLFPFRSFWLNEGFIVLFSKFHRAFPKNFRAIFISYQKEGIQFCFFLYLPVLVTDSSVMILKGGQAVERGIWMSSGWTIGQKLCRHIETLVGDCWYLPDLGLIYPLELTQICHRPSGLWAFCASKFNHSPVCFHSWLDSTLHWCFPMITVVFFDCLSKFGFIRTNLACIVLAMITS